MCECVYAHMGMCRGRTRDGTLVPREGNSDHVRPAHSGSALPFRSTRWEEGGCSTWSGGLGQWAAALRRATLSPERSKGATPFSLSQGNCRNPFVFVSLVLTALAINIFEIG